MQVDFRRGVPKTAHWKSSVSGIPFILTPEKKCNQVAIPLKRDFLQLISHNCWWLYMLPLYHLGLWKYNKHKSNIPDGQYSLRQSHILKPTVWLHGSADGVEQWEWSSDPPPLCVRDTVSNLWLDLVCETRPTVLLPWIAGINLSCYSHRPYVIDLESTNGTYVNNQRIEPARYYELKEKVCVVRNLLWK